MKRNFIVVVLLFGLFNFSFAADYYVSISGSDASGRGSQASPWRTLKFALSKVSANQGHTIHISAGTFVEQGPLVVPPQVNIHGAGSATIIKAASSFYYKETRWDFSKFLFQATSRYSTRGGQSIKNFVIDGDSRNLYGGIMVRQRTHVLIEGVTVQYTGFVGIWLINVQDSRITNTKLRDCAWSSSAYQSGSICISDVDRVELDHLNIVEKYGMALKAMGRKGGYVNNTKVHDSYMETTPTPLWLDPKTGSKTPSIVFEYWGYHLRGNEIYNNHFLGNVSLVTYGEDFEFPTNRQTVRVYNNLFDTWSHSYGLELSIHDAEVDHNFFSGGTWGITDFAHTLYHPNSPYQNWKVHHNIFYKIQSSQIPGMIRSQNIGLRNIEFYNNTVEFTGAYSNAIVNIVKGVGSNIKIKNNLIINNTTGSSPQMVRLGSGVSLSGLEVTNNFLQNMSVGSIPGTYSSNLSGDPQINRSGNRPSPYYMQKAGSPLIDKGVNVGFSYSGSAPDIGAYESGTAVAPPTNKPPQGAISSPASNAVFAEGITIKIDANAADPDGTVSKVEFFVGSYKLGEDTSEPYSIDWKNPRAGTPSLSIQITDDKGATFKSPAVTITIVAASNTAPNVSITSPASNATFDEGAKITIQANATDSDGSITLVEFYSGSTKLGEDNTSPYSYEWTNAEPGSHSITAKATDDKGEKKSSGAITISVLADANTAPTVALSSPDNNSTHMEGDAITLRATSGDTDGSVSKVEFFQGTIKLGEDDTAPYTLAWSNAKVGTYTVTAKATDDKNAVGTSAPLNIHVKAPSNSLPVVELTSPRNGTTLNSGNITFSATATDSDGAVTKVEFFNGTTKLGEDLSSPYGHTWNSVKPGKYNLTARATDNKSGATTSAAVTITVVDPNKKPAVAITSPANNASFNQGTSVTIKVNATDSDGAIGKVEFFNGTTKLGEDTSSPYSYTWTNVKAGKYTITAKATDNRSGVTTSTGVAITVVVPNKAPVIAITSPANNATFTEGQSIPIKATATDSDGTITRVEFFRGTTLLGEDTSDPYSLDWPNALPGQYEITARATDNSGAKAATKINIEVKEQIFVPLARAGNDISVELPENSVKLSGQGESDNGDVVKYEWVQIEGPEDATIDAAPDGEAVIGNLTEGTYRFELTITDIKNMKATDVITVRVYPLPLASVELPRIFSPNGDGINDYWEWSNTELFRDSRLVIFNRHGQKIYEVTGYDNTWDGSVNGSPLQEDAYYYVISSNQGELTGAVRIVR